jgi:hypothetical protein
MKLNNIYESLKYNDEYIFEFKDLEKHYSCIIFIIFNKMNVLKLQNFLIIIRRKRIINSIGRVSRLQRKS